MSTWADIKSEILNLGFEKTATYTKYQSIIIEAVNRALTTICATVRPLKTCCTVEQAADAEYDMSTAVNDFMTFIRPVKVSGEDIPAQYRQTGVTKVAISGAGTYDIWYSAVPARITAATADSYVLPLQADVAVLLPLLAAYFVWLDDDERKAVMYWNNYEDIKAQILALDDKNAPVTARVNTELSGLYI